MYKMVFIGNDPIDAICSFLEPKELMTIRSTNSYINQLCDNMEVWKSLWSDLHDKHRYLQNKMTKESYIEECRRLQYIKDLSLYLPKFCISQNALDVIFKHKISPLDLASKVKYQKVDYYLKYHVIDVIMLKNMGLQFDIEDIHSYKKSNFESILEGITDTIDKSDPSIYTYVLWKKAKKCQQKESCNNYDMNGSLNINSMSTFFSSENKYLCALMTNKILSENGYMIIISNQNFDYKYYNSIYTMFSPNDIDQYYDDYDMYDNLYTDYTHEFRLPKERMRYKCVY